MKAEILAIIILPYIICLLVIWNLPLIAPKDVVPVPVNVTHDEIIESCVTSGGTFTATLADRCENCEMAVILSPEDMRTELHFSVNNRAAIVAKCLLPAEVIRY